jgi:hypothetical protein
LLLQALTQPGVGEDPKARFDGLLDAMLKGVAK